MIENNFNELDPFLGQIIRIDNEYHKLPLYGRLIAISPQFLTIERKDGRLTLIKRKAILAIEAVRNQQGPSEAV
jgi:hypothetical protein